MHIATLFATSNLRLFDDVARMLRNQTDIALHPIPVREFEALTIVRIRRFDVLLIDVEPLGRPPLETIRSVAALAPAVRSLLFRAECSDHFAIEVLRSGGGGCISTECKGPLLARAIRVLNAGDFWAPRAIVARAFRPLAAQPSDKVATDGDAYTSLSPREREIVEWMRTGMSNKEIARELGISDMTVKTHAHNIFNKLEVSGRLRLFGVRHVGNPRLVPGI